MVARCLAVTILLCIAAIEMPMNVQGQSVKSNFDKSANFAKYKNYSWGSNYLLTRQTKKDEALINLAIIDSINRDLKAAGFVLVQENPDFVIIYEAGGFAKADVGQQGNVFYTDMVNFTWVNVMGTTSDVWAYSLAKMRITVTDAATKKTLWQATASQKIRDPMKFMENLQLNVDKYIQKAMKSFPPNK
jgi:Domain of unknown function (DUF4136)